MVAKFILLKFIPFDFGFVKLRKKIFNVATATPQIFLLVFLAVAQKFINFHYE